MNELSWPYTTLAYMLPVDLLFPWVRKTSLASIIRRRMKGPLRKGDAGDLMDFGIERSCIEKLDEIQVLGNDQETFK